METLECSCGSGGCSSGDFYSDLEDRLVGMAYWAQKKALFERIKQRVEKEDGARLDKIADIVMEMSRMDSRNSQEMAKKRDELHDRLREIFEE